MCPKFNLRPLILAIILVQMLVAANEVEAQPSVVIQNDSMWFDSFLGWLYIVGEIKNTGNLWLVWPPITITCVLRDKNGFTLSEEKTNALLAVVPPGETAPFEIWVTHARIASETRSYTLRTVGSHLSVGADVAAKLVAKLVVQDVSEEKSTAGLRAVAGYVRNQGSEISRVTQVTGTFYNSTGKVVYVESQPTDPLNLPPGSTASFRLPLDEERSQSITEYRLVAESDEYTSLSEFSWPVFSAGIVALLTIVVVRRRNRSKWTASS